jgi:hypothetical protein
MRAAGIMTPKSEETKDGAVDHLEQHHLPNAPTGGELRRVH